MAEFVPGISTCAICGQLIEDISTCVATTHFDQSRRFEEFSDSIMHQACFQQWNMRARFIRRFNQIMQTKPEADGSYQEMLADGQIVVRRAN